jgi:hypothetical protein
MIGICLGPFLPPSCIKSISFSAYSSPIIWDPLSKLLVIVEFIAFDGTDEDYVFLGKRLVENFQTIRGFFYTSKIFKIQNQKSCTLKNFCFIHFSCKQTLTDSSDRLFITIRFDSG